MVLKAHSITFYSVTPTKDVTNMSVHWADGKSPKDSPYPSTCAKIFRTLGWPRLTKKAP